VTRHGSRKIWAAYRFASSYDRQAPARFCFLFGDRQCAAGSHKKTVDIACPVCGPQREGASAKRKVLRTWTLGGDRISLHCARCGLEGYVVPDGGVVDRSKPEPVPVSHDDDEDARKRHNAAARIWKESYPIAGTAAKIGPARAPICYRRRGSTLAQIAFRLSAD